MKIKNGEQARQVGYFCYAHCGLRVNVRTDITDSVRVIEFANQAVQKKKDKKKGACKRPRRTNTVAKYFLPSSVC